MAKINVEDKGKVKFRFVEFELEGLNSTIEESIKSIVHSMNRGSETLQRMLPQKSASPLVLPSNGNTDGAPYLEEEPVDSEAGVPDDESKSSSSPSAGSKLRRYTQPKFLSNLDLDSGPLPLKTF